MHRSILIAALALASGAVFAQAPAGVTKPPAEVNPNASGGKAQAKGEMNAETKGSKAGTMASANTTASMGNKAMDMNGDGFVSRKEWDSYYGKMWTGMKPDKKGMVPWTNVEAAMQGGTPK